MSYKKYTEKESVSAEELETASEALIEAKFDREKRADWTQKLKENYGVTRTVAKPKRRFLFSKIAIAAILIVLVGIVTSIVLFSSSKYETVLQESIENLILIDNYAVTTRGDEDVNTEVLKAIEAYKNKQFEESIDIWEKFVANGKIKGTAAYNLALCHIQKEPPAAKIAVEYLQKARTDTTVQQEANWALALAYLQLGEKEKGKAILQEILQAKAYKQQKAAKILELL